MSDEMFSKCPCILIKVKSQWRFISPLRAEITHFDNLEHKRILVKLADISILNVLFCYHVRLCVNFR